MGQEGWTSPSDPRYALAFVNTGPSIPARPSYVRGSAFHDCFATGIGVFGASGINVTENVVYRPLNDGTFHLCKLSWTY